MSLTKKEEQELLRLLELQKKSFIENQIKHYFPDEDKLNPITGKFIFSRNKYPKQMQFFKAGSKYTERAMVAANRCGKSFAGGYEMVCHLTGIYPSWWEGKRFNHAIEAWAAGKTNESTRDVIQGILLGKKGEYGTGLIPKSLVDKARITSRPGIPDAVNDIYIPHVSGGISQLTLKSYQQGQDSFMGTARHVIWLDEEPTSYNIYSECLTRVMTTGGIIYCTFTPLYGITEVVKSFLPNNKFPKYDEELNYIRG